MEISNRSTFIEGTNELWGVFLYEPFAPWDADDELRVLEERGTSITDAGMYIGTDARTWRENAHDAEPSR